MTPPRLGRPHGTGRYREPTQVMRVPASQVPVVIAPSTPMLAARPLSPPRWR